VDEIEQFSDTAMAGKRLALSKRHLSLKGGRDSKLACSNLTAIKRANVHFDGGVASRTILFPDGSRNTLGRMQPAEYAFGADAAEVMEIERAGWTTYGYP
jgi:hypothetical protein